MFQTIMLARNIHPTWEIHFIGDTKHIQDTETIQYGLVGGFFHPIEKYYSSQIGSSPQRSGGT